MRGWTGTYAVAAAVGAGVAVAARVVAVHVLAVDLAQLPSLQSGQHAAPRLKQAAMIEFGTYDYVVLEEARGGDVRRSAGEKVYQENTHAAAILGAFAANQA